MANRLSETTLEKDRDHRMSTYSGDVPPRQVFFGYRLVHIDRTLPGAEKQNHVASVSEDLMLQ